MADDSETTDRNESVPAIDADLGAAVESWFSRHFHNLGGEISERTYNRLHAAKEDLKVSLADFTRSSPA